jgi:transcriptional regulator with XRE-family HTH domain
MAKSTLRKAENETSWLVIGQAIDRARTACQLSVKEFASAVQRDERQVARWFNGSERPQVDAVYAVECFRQPLIVALAERAGVGVEVTTAITMRRIA